MPDRMSPLDSAFLHLEDGTTSLHIASLAIFEGPAPAQEEIAAAIARKLPLVPRYRQRMREVPLRLGRPVWVDHAAFDLDRHLSRVTLDPPGGTAELQELTGQLMSEPLDRALPLWQDVVIDGLADGRWAMITKVHHSMVDGIAGTDLLSTVFDSSPEPDPVPVDDWDPAPAPGALALMTGALRERAAVPVREVRTVGHALRAVRSTATQVYGLGRGVATYATALRPFSGSSLAGPIGTSRQYRWSEVEIADLLTVRSALGGTLNDVVLAMVARGFRELLLTRREHIGAHTVRTLVPVSVRHADERGHLDNRVSAIVAELPVTAENAVEGLRRAHEMMGRLKASHEAEAGEVLTELADLVPPPLLATALHVAFRVPHRILTTVVTNVPGPTAPLYFAGRRMLATYPYVPIADRVRIGVAVTSYDGRLLFGVTSDAASAPDTDVLLAGLHTGLAELQGAARA